MKYPVDVETYVKTALSVFDTYDDEDVILVTAMAEAINKAYYAGLEDGRNEK